MVLWATLFTTNSKTADNFLHQLFFLNTSAYSFNFYLRYTQFVHICANPFSHSLVYPIEFLVLSGDTEQVAEKLDKGLLDFVVLAELSDPAKYESLVFPKADTWGVIMPSGAPLAKKKAIRVDDLIGLPLFCSGQAWKRYQAFSPIAEIFLQQIKSSFTK